MFVFSCRTTRLSTQFSIIIFLCAAVHAQDVIDVNEHGISNAVRNSQQIDRDEAIMDAKLKAIEKAGVNIEAVTEVENFVLKRDWIESQAEGVLLPGFQIIETGYGEDGLYHVVLIGKLRASPQEQSYGGPTEIISGNRLVYSNKLAVLELESISIVDNGDSTLTISGSIKNAGVRRADDVDLWGTWRTGRQSKFEIQSPVRMFKRGDKKVAVISIEPGERAIIMSVHTNRGIWSRNPVSNLKSYEFYWIEYVDQPIEQ